MNVYTGAIGLRNWGARGILELAGGILLVLVATAAAWLSLYAYGKGEGFAAIAVGTNALGVILIAWAAAYAWRNHRAIAAIHERTRENEQQLRISEVRYRRLFEAAHDGVLLVDPATRKITDANPFMARLLGYSHQELMGKELWEIGLLRDAEASQAAFEQLLKEGAIRYENLPLQAKTGERREVEFVSNVYQENDRPTVQCNIRDITEHRRAQTIQRSYQTLFESAPGLYLVLAPEDFEIVAVSEAYLRATMTQRESILGKRLFEVFPDDPREPTSQGRNGPHGPRSPVCLRT